MPNLNKLFRCLFVLVVLAGTAFIIETPVSYAGTESEDAVELTNDDDSLTEPVESGEVEGAEEDEELTLWGIIALGGKLMYLLAFLSFLTIVLITFYFLSLTPSNAVPPLFAKKIHEMISNQRTSEAKMFCEQHDNILSRILKKGLLTTDKGHKAVVESMHSEGERQASGLWQRISYLADIAIVAPMVGLLGTTVGMMHTFMEMRTSLAIGGVKPASMAGGIFEAMVTTVAGLIIAIIATSFYAYFRGVVQRIVTTLEEVSTQYAELFEGESGTGGPKE